MTHYIATNADPADAFPVIPATSTLVEMVKQAGGDVCWSVKNGIACTDD